MNYPVDILALSNTIQKAGSSLEEYFDEIVNSYSTKNDKSLSNAIAESTNAKIQKSYQTRTV